MSTGVTNCHTQHGLSVSRKIQHMYTLVFSNLNPKLYAQDKEVHMSTKRHVPKCSHRHYKKQSSNWLVCTTVTDPGNLQNRVCQGGGSTSTSESTEGGMLTLVADVVLGHCISQLLLLGLYFSFGATSSGAQCLLQPLHLGTTPGDA